MDKQWLGPRSIPLNLILVIPFLLELSLAVGLTGFLSLRNGERAVQNAHPAVEPLPVAAYPWPITLP